MYSFEGAFKSPLNQSLGRKNLSKKDELLAAAQQKRSQREQYRLKTCSAVKIQACFRSYLARKKEFAKRRTEFTNLLAILRKGPPTSGLVESIIQSINLFFAPEIDDMAMVVLRMVTSLRTKEGLISEDQAKVSLCSLAIKYQSEFQQFMFCKSKTHRWQVKKWLRRVCGVLQRLSGTTENISMLLRVLEVYLDVELYESNLRHGSEMLGHIYDDLIVNGYFKTMRDLCDDRIPDSIDIGTVAPTPLASSLLALILRPLLLSNTHGSLCRSKVLRYFCISFMSQTYTPQIYCYILPCIRAEPNILVTDIMGAVMMDVAEPCLDYNATILHSLMVILEEHVESFDEKTLGDYLYFITKLFPHLSDPDFLNLDDNSSGSMDWSSDETNSAIDLPQMRAECIQIVNTPKHVSRFMKLCAGSDSSVLPVAQLCHILTSQLNQKVHANRLMYSLALNKSLLRKLWNECQSLSVINSAGNPVSLIQVLSRGLGDSLYTSASVQGGIHSLVSLLSAFSSLFYHSVLTLHDDDFKPKAVHLQAPTAPANTSSSTFSRQELVQMVALLRDACLGVVYLALPDSKPVFEDRRKFLEDLGIKTNPEKTITKESYMKQRSEWIYLFTVMSRLTKHLYIRDTRTHFCPATHWLSSQVKVHANDLQSIYRNHIEIFDQRPLKTVFEEDDEDSIVMSINESRRLVVLMELPFVVSFEERVRIFHNLLSADRANHQTGFDGYGPMADAAINVNIRRDYIYEDAFEKLSTENEPNLKPKIRVHMKNTSGLDEAGIDGGGIFREFMSEFLNTGFDPNRGLFKLTASNDKMLYPNPEAPVVLENCEKHFFFLGRILGKALYENLLVDLPFAGFFLTKILGKSESDFHQLSSLDPTLYKNLLFVKNYPGDVTELGLDFSVVNEVLGVTSHVELKPNGKNIVVNNNNRIEYVHLMADYKLNRQIRLQCQAFTQGLEDILKLEWLKMFNHHELHTLISGATSPIDINDLRVHTTYSGTYNSDHPTIHMFWKIVYGFSPSQRSALLKFITSCSRPPLLGFKNLHPALCIHYGGQEDRLPTASTCMNFLKLPDYPDEATMKSKLLYAIESGAGFELS